MATRIGNKSRHRAGGHPRSDRVRTRSEDDGYPCAQNDACSVGLQEKSEVFCRHVAGFKVWHDQDLCLAGHLRFYALDRRSFRMIALSKASGPSRMPPVIWPRSAILQSAAASMVEGIFDVTVSTADRMATLGVPWPMLL